MFAKLCNWAVMGTLACALGACGGGEPEGGVATAPAASADVLAASAATVGADSAIAGALEQGAGGIPAQTVSRTDGAMQPAVAGVSYQTSSQVVAMHGSSAYAIRDAVRARLEQGSRVLATRQTDPDLADEDERERMMLLEAEYEKSFSIEKNREWAEHRAKEGIDEPVVQQAYVPHEDCVDPRLPECNGGRLARY